MRKTLLILLLAGLSAGAFAQTEKSYIVQGGGTGPCKAFVVGDASLPNFTIYRPQDLKSLGKLPVLLYANGGCANSTVQMRFLLNEVASYGYIVVGIGPYEEEDPIENWKNVMRNMFPEGKDVVLANGEKVKAPTPAEVKARQEAQQRRREEMARAQQNNPRPAAPRTYPRQLLEALDWLGTLIKAVMRKETLALLGLPLILIRFPWDLKMPRWLGYALYPGHLAFLMVLKVIFFGL